ncbi:MAG: DUF3343 domain-containing protein [Oscillospiraceae bacterium]|nr:DUF3343 domain-containing protein [Oscillospiraceae bacterium]
MTNYLLICRSLTYAQRASKVLKSAGIPASISRIPKEIATNGCGYCVRLAEKWLSRSLELLNNTGLQPIKVYAWYGYENYAEV